MSSQSKTKAGSKIDLIVKPERSGYQPEGRTEFDVSRALPYFKSNAGIYVHHIRSMRVFWRDGEYSHTSISYWCGNLGFLSKGKMLPAVGLNTLVCACCKGKFIGAGKAGPRRINKQLVGYKPRI